MNETQLRLIDGKQSVSYNNRKCWSYWSGLTLLIALSSAALPATGLGESHLSLQGTGKEDSGARWAIVRDKTGSDNVIFEGDRIEGIGFLAAVEEKCVVVKRFEDSTVSTSSTKNPAAKSGDAQSRKASRIPDPSHRLVRYCFGKSLPSAVTESKKPTLKNVATQDLPIHAGNFERLLNSLNDWVGQGGNGRIVHNDKGEVKGYHVSKLGADNMLQHFNVAEGDIVTSINRKRIKSEKDFTTLVMDNEQSGEMLIVEYERNGLQQAQAYLLEGSILDQISREWEEPNS